MGKRTIFVVIVIMLSFGLSAVYGLGNGNEKPGVLQKIKNAYNSFRGRQQQKSQAIDNKVLKDISAPEDQLKDKEMTKEEIFAQLKEDLIDNEEVFDAVPELKISKDQDGNIAYTYKGTALGELSKEDLAKLYSRVRQALVKVRIDRMQGQLETIRQVERLQNRTNPQPPRVPTQTQPPRIPSAPPSVPKTPSSPPSVPQRR